MIAIGYGVKLRARRHGRNLENPMPYEAAFQGNKALIDKLGVSNAHLIWSLGLYLEEPDLEALASEGLTDGPNDKKIDFIHFDPDQHRILFAQGYYAGSDRESAPANKASDLNTAAAWLFSGNLDSVPEQLKSAIEFCRTALADGDVEIIELLYVHNLPESVNVTRELQTAADHLHKGLGSPASIVVGGRELGRSQIEQLWASQDSHIEVKERVLCPAKIHFIETGPKWSAYVATVPGLWLHELYNKYKDPLFSANYRGFLGTTKRRRVNSGIRQTAETKPKDFWVFNNGVAILTLKVGEEKSGTELSGVSVINGAQTTGSLGSIDITRYPLGDVKVLCRIVECSDDETIQEIVKFNNSQNEITTWDQYSNDADQNRLQSEFQELGYPYSKKRGFRGQPDEISIEDVAQPLVAFHGRFRDANRGRNDIFETKVLYRLAFSDKKARHVLFVYTLARAIDERRLELKQKSSSGSIIEMEEKQLLLMRNLRFKFFFVYVMSRLLEVFLGQKVDLETVAFSAEAASAKANSIVALIALWSPLVEAALAYTATLLSGSDLARQIGEQEAVDKIYCQVESLLYAGRNALKTEAFRKIVQAS